MLIIRCSNSDHKSLSGKEYKYFKRCNVKMAVISVSDNVRVLHILLPISELKCMLNFSLRLIKALRIFKTNEKS